MRRLAYLSILCLLLSCAVDHEKEQLFADIQKQIMDGSADSVLLLLDSLQPQKAEMPKRYRMRYELLRAQALNKAFIPLDTLTVMDTVVDYYESHGNHVDKMIANYMMGCVHRDKGNSPVALEFYRKAVDYADTTNLSEVRMMSRIYGQIADLFNQQRTPQMEIKAEKEAIRLALKAKDTIVATEYYYYLSAPYHMMNRLDSALTIAQKSADMYAQKNRPDLVASTMPIIIDINLQRNRCQEAKSAMDLFEQHSGLFKQNGDIQSGHEIYYFYKGLYYEKIEKDDSALYYYRKLMKYPQIENFQASYEGLTRIYKKIGQPDSVMKYAFLFGQANDSICLKSSSEEIIRTQALYDYSENQRLAVIRTKEAEHLRTILYLIFIAMGILSYLIYKYIRNQRLKRLQELAVVNTQYSNILAQYNQALKEMTALKDDYKQFQTEKQKEIDDIKQTLSVYQDDNTNPEQWNIEHALMNSRIVVQLHQLAAKANIASNAEWKDLYETVSHYLPDFYQQIHKSQFALTEKELAVCILSKLRFIPSEMAALLGLSSQRITNIRSNINYKLFNEKSAQTLYANISQI